MEYISKKNGVEMGVDSMNSITEVAEARLRIRLQSGPWDAIARMASRGKAVQQSVTRFGHGCL